MLNEKKIALMTKMAIYEQGEGKKSFPMSKYYRSDYLSLRLINVTIVVTVAYLLVVAMVVLVNFESILENLVTMDLLKTGKYLLGSYIAVTLINGLITYFVSRCRFRKYRRGLNEYNGNLKKLYAMNGRREKNSSGGRKNDKSTDDQRMV